jgi:hypothetical protein
MWRVGGEAVGMASAVVRRPATSVTDLRKDGMVDGYDRGVWEWCVWLWAIGYGVLVGVGV